MPNRRALLALTAALGSRSAAGASRLRRLRPAIFSLGQSQTGRGGSSPARTDPPFTDTVARFPDKLWMFQARTGVSGSMCDSVLRLSPRVPRVVNHFVPADYTGFAPYQDTPGLTINAATPFLFALTSRLDARGLIPNGLFGFTVWEGGAPLNSFLPPDDPEAGLVDLTGDGNPDIPSNFENLIAAVARYAEFTRAAGFEPVVPLIRFEQGESRIEPLGVPPDLADEKRRYIRAHLRMTTAIVAQIRQITGQKKGPLFLLGGWGGTDNITEVIDTAPYALDRLTTLRPDLYVGPTSSAYLAPLYNDGGPTSEVHPSFLGRILIGEIQALAADRCLDATLQPVPAGFAPFTCASVVAATPDRLAFDLTYRRPPYATGPIGFAVDAQLLPETPNHGFEYAGPDSARVAIVSVACTGLNTVRITFNRAPRPQGALLYGFGPRSPATADGQWNYRGNLVCPTDQPFFYAPILAAEPYDQQLPVFQRHVAAAQRITLP